MKSKAFNYDLIIDNNSFAAIR